MNSYRTHTCSELRAANIGKPTTLIGWVDSVRDHGGVIFIDLRDRSGITQVVFHPEVNQDVAKASQQLRSEDMIQISGTVAARLKRIRWTRPMRTSPPGKSKSPQTP